MAFHSDPLFVSDNGLPVTCSWFQAQLKSLLTQAGIPADGYSTHLFRTGAATTAANNSLPEHTPQTHFNPYIRSNLADLRQALLLIHVWAVLAKVFHFLAFFHSEYPLTLTRCS